MRSPAPWRVEREKSGQEAPSTIDSALAPSGSTHLTKVERPASMAADPCRPSRGEDQAYGKLVRALRSLLGDGATFEILPLFRDRASAPEEVPPTTSP